MARFRLFRRGLSGGERPAGQLLWIRRRLKGFARGDTVQKRAKRCAVMDQGVGHAKIAGDEPFAIQIVIAMTQCVVLIGEDEAILI